MGPVHVNLGREYPQVPLAAVGALIKEDDKFLIIKRRFEPSAGKWSIPGGLVEVGETVLDAVKREVEEKVGLQVSVDRLLDVVDDITRDKDSRMRFHYVLVDYLAHPIGGELKFNHELVGLEWVKAEDFEDYELTNTLRKLLRVLGIVPEKKLG